VSRGVRHLEFLGSVATKLFTNGLNIDNNNLIKLLIQDILS